MRCVQSSPFNARAFSRLLRGATPVPGPTRMSGTDGSAGSRRAPADKTGAAAERRINSHRFLSSRALNANNSPATHTARGAIAGAVLLRFSLRPSRAWGHPRGPVGPDGSLGEQPGHQTRPRAVKRGPPGCDGHQKLRGACCGFFGAMHGWKDRRIVSGRALAALTGNFPRREASNAVAACVCCVCAPECSLGEEAME